MSKTKTAVIDDSQAVAVEQATETKKKTSKNEERVRGKKYVEAKSKVDVEKTYLPEEAVALAKETSISSFGGSMQLHIVMKKGTFNKVLDLPHSAGKAKRVEIASDETVKNLQAGKITFDILVASPSMMPKLVPFARLLGPRGLMPNPKNGTISENPEAAAQKLGGNSLQVKSENKAPLIHTVFGSVKQDEKELVTNLNTILRAVELKNIDRVFVAASMGPSIKVAVA